MQPKITLDQLHQLPPTVDLMTAAHILGLGRTKAYALAKADQFPCRLIRVGDSYRIPTTALLELLGIPTPETREDADQRRVE